MATLVDLRWGDSAEKGNVLLLVLVLCAKIKISEPLLLCWYESIIRLGEVSDVLSAAAGAF